MINDFILLYVWVLLCSFSPSHCNSFQIFLCGNSSRILGIIPNLINSYSYLYFLFLLVRVRHCIFWNVQNGKVHYFNLVWALPFLTIIRLNILRFRAKTMPQMKRKRQGGCQIGTHSRQIGLTRPKFMSSADAYR